MDIETVDRVAGISVDRSLNYTADSNSSAKWGHYVLEEGTECFKSMEQLAIAVSCRRPVLLRGPVGSGKTSMVEALAAKHAKLLKVQLGQETDSRVLLGGYQVTDLPGQFLWKPGVLSQAVMGGHWILLEDIDCASSDVATLVDSLVKTGSMAVPGLSDNLRPHPDLQMFATQRTHHETEENSTLLRDWLTITLSSPTSSELSRIIVKRWPKLTAIADKLVSLLHLPCWQELMPPFRMPSPRDLFKLSSRADSYYRSGCPESALRIFHDAVDLMCGSLSKEGRLMIGEQIGFVLGIVKNKANFVCANYKPNIVITEGKFVVGRASLLLEKDSALTQIIIRQKRPIFSLTRPTCCLMEQIACCLDNYEPVLLVGETGCGKTSSLQYLAYVLQKNLIVINMSQQSETVDLLGGFKPVSLKWLVHPICDEFELLFRELYDMEKNALCMSKMATLLTAEKWEVLVQFMSHVQKRAITQIKSKLQQDTAEVPSKKRKLAGQENGNDSKGRAKWSKRLKEWQYLEQKISKLSKQLKAAEKSLIFSFVEGTLVKAVKRGDWVLLDEINLASSDTLDCLHGLLEGRDGSLALLERGDNKDVARASGFRLFAAMNPATDVGKAQLPLGLRNRFTEFFVDELDAAVDILPIVETYLRELNPSPDRLEKLVQFYLKLKRDSQSLILDGNGKKPHYSLRSLCRSLMVAAKNPCGSFPRSLFEGLCLSFLTQLDQKSYQMVMSMVLSTIMGPGDAKGLLMQPIPKPTDANTYVNIEGYWVSVGGAEPKTPDNYIMTDTVKRHLKDLLRVVSMGNGIPVLLEGDTSVGKTSLISYLAKCTGNICTRLNNHEHTDIQEYIGMYVADAKGKLVFKEGVLCEAMRKGYWLILDELNLAPTEVLEALNRVLDDNRELFVPETQTVIKAHPKFQLFATQNPPGQYGGRKQLSRAFRNRFVELQVSQIPSAELITILEKRCRMPVTYCKKMVAVMEELQLRRRGSEIFVGKTGFITLRDLFRWGERYQQAAQRTGFYDWEQHLADEGYILLTGRVRVDEERTIIKDVLLKHFKRTVDPNNLFSLHEKTSTVTRDILSKVLSYSRENTKFQHIVWTHSLRRLAVLVCKAVEFNEPVLLVGETGCGKTSVVQVLAAMRDQQLFSVNCHMHSESADFLGGLRPIRDHTRSDGKLFEWVDGPLVTAMTSGSWFLADEISLADDSVLERLNSLLEPERTILLVEKGGAANEDHVIQAQSSFSFIGTMNPGGDYGKKELSPALRNRLTEIWAGVTDNLLLDYKLIAIHNLHEISSKEAAAEVIVKFIDWFKTMHEGRKLEISVRDLLTWVEFINKTVTALTERSQTLSEGLFHGCALTFLDALSNADGMKNLAMKKISKLMQEESFPVEFSDSATFFRSSHKIGSHPFYIDVGNCAIDFSQQCLKYSAPTTMSNVAKVLRALQTGKAILLEGSPGVGKTSLIAGLAKDSGHKITRINLSDQTDVSDLFGADLPVEGAEGGHFQWRDGPFLTALKEEHWILLDELNLASQSVLEGLNAVLDHRGELFIPELNRTFVVPVGTRLFACQNPVSEGGSRRGLPKSFLNRFTRIYTEALTSEDYRVILEDIIEINQEWKVNLPSLMTEFSDRLTSLIASGKLGLMGSPWEINLRDLIRWCEAIRTEDDPRALFSYMKALYLHRFRTYLDRQTVLDTYQAVGLPGYMSDSSPPTLLLTSSAVHIEEVSIARRRDAFHGDIHDLVDLGVAGITAHGSAIGERSVRLLKHQSHLLELLARCVANNWLPILVGESGSGKTCAVRTLAALTGNPLRIMSVSAAMDTTEILGGFEQASISRHIEALSSAARVVVLTAALVAHNGDVAAALVQAWIQFIKTPVVPDTNGGSKSESRLSLLERLLHMDGICFDEDSVARRDALLKELRRIQTTYGDSGPNSAVAGRFEWVDSPFVKSLQDGSWLLLEDVNLCSNAVLDRLNAVVEPGGELTVGERGCREDGSLISIKPHPNFRLFFTVNPCNGTISRAMRNRGVEIFVERGESQSTCPLDMRSLVDDAGVCSPLHQKQIIAMHQATANRSDVHIGHLSAMAFWFAAYLRQGFKDEIALNKAFFLVYKAQAIADTTSPHCDILVDLNVARPKLIKAIHDPLDVKVRQSCSYLIALLQTYSNLSDDEKVDEDIVTEENLAYIILHIYLTITPQSKNATSAYLAPFLEQIPKLIHVAERCAVACPRPRELPWDLRWYRSNVTVSSNTNCVLGAMKYLHSVSMLPAVTSTDSSISVMMYYNLVKNGEINDLFPETQILRYFVPFLDSLETLLLTILLCDDSCWSDEALQWFLEVSIWAVRLRALGGLELLNRGRRTVVVSDTVTKVTLHLAWLRKRLLIPLMDAHFPITKVTPSVRLTLEKFLSFEKEVFSEVKLQTISVKKANGLRRFLQAPAPTSSIMLPKASKDSSSVIQTYLLNILAIRIQNEIINSSTLNLEAIWRNNLLRLNSSLGPLLELDFEHNILELKVMLLRINDDGYSLKMTSESEEFMPEILLLHRPVITSETLSKVFPRVPVNLLSVDKNQEERLGIVAALLPNAHILMQISNEQKSRLAGEISLLLPTLTTIDQNDSPAANRLYKAVSLLESCENRDCLWVLLGLVQTLILAGGTVDPIRKKLIKTEYAVGEVKNITAELKSHLMNSQVTQTKMSHVYISCLERLKDKAHVSMSRYKAIEGVDRDPPLFHSLCTEIENAVRQLADRVIGLVERVESGERSEKLLETAVVLLQSFKVLVEKVEEQFLEKFPDLALPFLYTLQQLVHGLNAISTNLNTRELDATQTFSSICQFPLQCLTANSIEMQLKRFMTLPGTYPSHRFSLLSTSLQHLANERFSSGADVIGLAMRVCQEFVIAWQRQEREKELEQEEKESLYLKKGVTKCKELSEEEELLAEQDRLFPTFSSHFEVIEVGSLNTQIPDEPKSKEGDTSQLGLDCLNLVKTLHISLTEDVVKTSWMDALSIDVAPDFTEPLRERYFLLNSIFPQVYQSLSPDLDTSLLAGLLAMLSLRPKHPDLGADFYRKGNTLEVNRCIPVLVELKTRISELLQEWPEHPTLIQINTIIERVFSLPVESPVACYLTGMEFLHQSCQHWESVAHSGVSLAIHLKRISDISVSWRQLELKGWKCCLEDSQKRIKKEACKWWYHLWCLIEEYHTKEEKKPTLDSLLQALADFIETSPLAEFSERLLILRSFHNHALLSIRHGDEDELPIRIWNLYRFYNQYAPSVEQKKHQLELPVLKQVQNYVKIVKWHDSSYWSVKQSLDKSHRTLVKYIKECEKIYKQKVDLNAMDVSTPPSNQSDKPMNVEKYFVRITAGAESSVTPLIGSKFTNPTALLKKTQQYCKKTIIATSYPYLLETAHNLTVEVISNMEHFSSVEPDKNLPEEKRKGQIKSMIQQKRRALSDLFSTLTRLGLSYRIGNTSEGWGPQQLSRGPPLVAYQGKQGFSGEDYYLKAAARFLQLQNKLLQPSKDIGPPIIERLRGFASHLMEIVQKMYSTLSDTREVFTYLQEIESSLLQTKEDYIPLQSNLHSKVRSLREILCSTLYVMNQFSYVLGAWPENNSDMLKTSNMNIEDLPPVLLSSKTDDAYQKVKKQEESIRNSLDLIRKDLDTNFPIHSKFKLAISEQGSLVTHSEGLILYSKRHEDVYSNSLQKLQQAFQTIAELKNAFGTEGNNPIVSCLGFDSEREALNTLVDDLGPSIEVQLSPEEDILRGKVEEAVQCVLMGIQKLLKKYKKAEEDDSHPEQKEDAEDPLDLYENHLTKELVGNLKLDLDELSMRTTLNSYAALSESLIEMRETSTVSPAVLQLMRSSMPYLSQYLKLCEYFLDQQISTFRVTAKFSSILLGVFTAVAEKGFCIPPDMEDGEGEGMEGKEGGGLGLGEGEGKTDVSERIESEDQLEDARPEGEQKEDKEELECEEEEKGIETAEDFGGKAQDLKEKDEDDEDDGQDEDDEEPDKEMGETEEGAEQLDKELWGSDAEDENEEALPEDTGGGESKGEDMYGAKEDGDDDQGQGDERKEKKDKQDITEMDQGEEDTDQIDPHHGDLQPPPEAEPFDLPDDMQLDEEEGKEKDENEENPFDIDEMKEPQLPPEKDDSKETDDRDAEEERKEEEKDGDAEEEVDHEGAEEEGGDEAGNEIEDLKHGGDGPEEDDQEGTEKDEVRQDKFSPSDDRPSSDPAQPAPDTNKKQQQSVDQVVGDSSAQDTGEAEEKTEERNEEGQGVGQADEEQSAAGHEASTAKKAVSHISKTERDRKRPERPGKSDEDRALGDRKQSDAKRMRTIEKSDRDEGIEEGETLEDIDLVQHVKQGQESSLQTFDAATEEQTEAQDAPFNDEDEGEQPQTEVMDLDDETADDDNVINEVNPNKTETQIAGEGNEAQKGEGQTEESKMQTDGETVATLIVPRGGDSSLIVDTSLLSQLAQPMLPEQVQLLRSQIQEQLLLLRKGPVSPESATAWQLLNSAVENLSRELSEQLRLVLEPSLATRLKGDYRTGRRINMRKVISYIASEFRKDRIWLRRTKPWKREHQIVLAIDDSSSMADNKSKELAFESLALVSKALNFLEAGDLSVVSFGEKSRILHPLGEPFTDETGARLITEFTFEQTKTNISEVVDVSCAMFAGCRRRNAAQLLLIVSDGRGVFSEGLDPVKYAVRRALTANVFIVFVVIDDPKSKDSILDIRMPEFKDGKFTGIKSYMENFPFPYYLILRDISALPGTLCDALRQWFQLTMQQP